MALFAWALIEFALIGSRSWHGGQLWQSLRVVMLLLLRLLNNQLILVLIWPWIRAIP